MKQSVLLSLLLALGCERIHAAPVEKEGLQQGSCTDPAVVAAAKLGLSKINKDRQDGYIFSLHRLSNAHIAKHGENGAVFYLTLDVVETNCSVLSRKDYKDCEARPTHDTPVYGLCKLAIYISKVHRVVRLYKYDCTLRPVPAARVSEICPDCPSHLNFDNDEIQKTVSQSLEKFNKDGGLSNRFALLKITRATSGMASSMYYNAEYTIKETTCLQSAEAVAADKCPPMDCEFAHKGFCKASHFHSPAGDSEISVECEIYEPEAAEREKKVHFLGGETDHSHNDTHTHSHDQDQAHTHDHVHDHTKTHSHHDETQKHSHDSDHHHTHDHEVGSSHRHAHDHSHDHGHGHDHVHAHHAKAHNHDGDSPNHHHNYKHAEGGHTHEHDHEIALDHDHKHAHLHEHEHHHHHHGHDHESSAHDHPEGTVRMLPSIDQSTTQTAFPDKPVGAQEIGVTLPLIPDPEIPGETQPTITAFPISVSAECAAAAVGTTLVEKLFAEDPLFKATA